MDLVSQNLLLTSGGKKDPTYIDDVFSTYLWKGDGQTGRPISNGIKLSNNNAGNSVYFDGSGDNLLAASSSEFTMTGDFTMECWFNPTSVSGVNVILNGRGNAGSGGPVIYINGTTLVFDNGTGTVCSQSSAVAVDTWYHVAGTRSGNTWTLYKNGSSVATGSDSTSYSSAVGFYIGQSHHGNEDYNGSISNVRITKGQVIYTSNFTPSTQALTTTSQGATASNVKLLCCQSSTSATAATKSPTTITANGNVQAQAFGPFTATDGEGGLVWMKSRTTGNVNVLFDTVRGANQRLRSDSDLGQSNADTLQPSFTNSGFTVGSGNEVNGSGNDYTSWTWRKQKGFFDIVTYTGTGVTQNIAHNLGSVPGAIFLKRTDSSHNWGVYHRGLNKGVTPERYRQRLNVAGQEDGNNDNGESYWANTAPTSTHFTVSGPVANNNNTNVSGATYVAYIFAGGANTAATARSVDFDGSGDYLSLSPSSDFAFGTGDYTVECWIKPKVLPTAGYLQIIFNTGGADNNTFFFHISKNQISVGNQNAYISNQPFTNFENGNWYHIAACRSGTTLRLFVNGVQAGSNATDNINWLSEGTNVKIGTDDGFNQTFNGKISNFRVVKGTALYTSSFRPTYEPLTNITNTKLLCCNNSSTTGSTVTPGTITANGNPTASSDSPFDDPEGFKFGEEGDQNIIKCGNFVTDTTNGFTLDLPWEPQWLFFKQNNANNNWIILDSMRGWTADGVVDMLYPNVVNAESSGSGYEKLLGNTIRFQGYGNNYDFMYIAVRRPDPLVAKPVEAGTDVFNAVMGTSNSDVPAFVSGFVTDFAFNRQPTATEDWWTQSRLTGDKYLRANTSGSQGTSTPNKWDYNNGWYAATSDQSAYQSWMWKRHAGFDVVCYQGNGGTTGGRRIRHSLNQKPQMIWIKHRNSANYNWAVYAEGLNGGTNPEQKYLHLNTNDSQSTLSNVWNDMPPTSNDFVIGSNDMVNNGSQPFIAMLFASVEGISKVGYYAGTGSAVTVTTGFLPRLVIIKRVDSGSNWVLLDSLRGLQTTSDSILRLNDTNAQYGNSDNVQTSSTGFTVPVGPGDFNNGDTAGRWIYYAHA